MFLGDGPLGYVINGKSFPATTPLMAKKGDWVLIHMANDGSLLHPMHLHGFHFEVVAQDGFPLDQPYMADTLVIAPGQTLRRPGARRLARGMGLPLPHPAPRGRAAGDVRDGHRVGGAVAPSAGLEREDRPQGGPFIGDAGDREGAVQPADAIFQVRQPHAGARGFGVEAGAIVVDLELGSALDATERDPARGRSACRPTFESASRVSCTMSAAREASSAATRRVHVATIVRMLALRLEILGRAP